MDQIRYSLGVCPQHDVLFDNLTVREHILFFAQLKGTSFEAANEDATKLTTLFHLEERLDHLGGELSGGQRRKLSVAIAVCGGSKFIVLDEPTAGMDPLARRELWDLLAGLRKGRTMLLTTHYMDEADILGDRVGIMSLGQMQCVGSTQFLKSTYGAGYKLVFDKAEGMDADQLGNLTSFVKAFIPEAQYFEEDGADTQAMYSLPFSTVSKFGEFFTRLDSNLKALSVSTYGINITSLEDVFLKVGEDHSVTPQVTSHGIGKNRVFESNFSSQVIGISRRKLTYALNDFTTIPLLLLPIAVSVTAAVLLNQQVISSQAEINDVVVAAMYMGGYLGVPGLISEFIVRERNDKLRNLLTVMGCDFRAYWLGTLIADYIIMSIPMVCMWITWFGAGMTDFYETKGGINFLITIIFNLQMIAFSYFFSFIFSSPKSAISFMPICIIMLLITPNITLLICILIARGAGASIGQDVQGEELALQEKNILHLYLYYLYYSRLSMIIIIMIIICD
jgi:ABC-type multidrug transport system ATPase subunit